MRPRPTARLTPLLAIAAAVLAGACSDTTVEPAPPTTLSGKSAARSDSGGPTTRPDSARADTSHGTRPDTVHAQPDSSRDSSRVGAGTLWAMTVENFSFQWRDAAGVAHDSVGFRGVAGVTVTVYATTRVDSTSGTPPQERLVATLRSDTTGQLRSDRLPDGWYTLRASGLAGGSARTAAASAQLVRGHQQPTIVYLNLR